MVGEDDEDDELEDELEEEDMDDIDDIPDRNSVSVILLAENQFHKLKTIKVKSCL